MERFRAILPRFTLGSFSEKRLAWLTGVPGGWMRWGSGIGGGDLGRKGRGIIVGSWWAKRMMVIHFSLGIVLKRQGKVKWDSAGGGLV